MSDWLCRVQLQILVLLSDGKPHSREEIHRCLSDDLGPLRNVRYHISRIRKFLPVDRHIVCEIFNRTVHYRHVRLLGGVPGKGRRRRSRAG